MRRAFAAFSFVGCAAIAGCSAFSGNGGQSASGADDASTNVDGNTSLDGSVTRGDDGGDMQLDGSPNVALDSGVPDAGAPFCLLHPLAALCFDFEGEPDASTAVFTTVNGGTQSVATTPVFDGTSVHLSLGAYTTGNPTALLVAGIDRMTAPVNGVTYTFSFYLPAKPGLGVGAFDLLTLDLALTGAKADFFVHLNQAADKLEILINGVSTLLAMPSAAMWHTGVVTVGPDTTTLKLDGTQVVSGVGPGALIVNVGLKHGAQGTASGDMPFEIDLDDLLLELD